MISFAADERARLCDQLLQGGPDAPTLCAGWTARDLAAHLVLRESRPDASVGVAVRPLAGYTERVRLEIAARPWEQLVREVRGGPPLWSPMRIRAVGELVNAVEFFVHHEDLRRAQPEWTPRPLEPSTQAMLWRTLQTGGGWLYRHGPVGVVLARPDGTRTTARRARAGRSVTVTGEPAELVLHAFGRQAHALVELDGDPLDVAALAAARLGP
ncbi:MAG TPA: TIGR03085 family metal-binding protein [Actinomycetes bacterium]|nr:TIGR03085 family metal-binding protein [Actinomycetes bacterium]